MEIKINDRPLKTSCGQENTFIELTIIILILILKLRYQYSSVGLDKSTLQLLFSKKFSESDNVLDFPLQAAF